MVDFNKLREQIKARGRFLGYCPLCDGNSINDRIYEIHILPAYRDAPSEEQKAKCPNCHKLVLIDELIQF